MPNTASLVYVDVSMNRARIAIAALLLLGLVTPGCSSAQPRHDRAPRTTRYDNENDHDNENDYRQPDLEPDEDAVQPAVIAPKPRRKRRVRRKRRRRSSGDVVKDWRHGAEIGRALITILDRAEQAATPAARQVLQTGRRMVVDDGTVIRGSCWTYANAVYKHAGIGRKQRKRVYKTGRHGPYIDPDQLQPGDFLSYINFSYNRGVHSAIFVGWLDRSRTEGLMLSYVGSRRARPGDYRSYRLTHVYAVYRPR